MLIMCYKMKQSTQNHIVWRVLCVIPYGIARSVHIQVYLLATVKPAVDDNQVNIIACHHDG